MLDELLAYLWNCRANIDKINYKNALIKFFKVDEVIVSRNVLLREAQKLSVELPNFSKSAQKEILFLEIIAAVKHIFDKHVDENFPTFVSSQFVRIMKCDAYYSAVEKGMSMLESAILKILDESVDILDEMKTDVQRLAENSVKGGDINDLKLNVQLLVDKSVELKVNHDNKLPEIKQKSKQINPVLNDVCDDFTLVQNKKRLKYSSIAALKASSTEIVGSLPTGVSKISASKILTRKRIFHVSNVNRCVAKDILEHLRSINVEAISCYPAFKARKNEAKPDDSHPSTSFRLCIDAKHVDVILKDSSWPEHVKVREWTFKET